MKNRYEINGDVTTLHMTHKGKPVTANIDTVDLPKLFKYTSFHIRAINGFRYVVGQYRRNGAYVQDYLHRIVMNATEMPRGIHVDHIFHDGTENRKEFLRLVTAKANAANRNPVLVLAKTSESLSTVQTDTARQVKDALDKAIVAIDSAVHQPVKKTVQQTTSKRPQKGIVSLLRNAMTGWARSKSEATNKA